MNVMGDGAEHVEVSVPSVTQQASASRVRDTAGIVDGNDSRD
jgi:hypothetical protein